MIKDLKDDCEKCSLIQSVGETEELTVFDSKALLDLIDFKWNVYAKYVHQVGLFSHLSYVIVFIIFVNTFYVTASASFKSPILYMLGICLIYPAIYDLT